MKYREKWILYKIRQNCYTEFWKGLPHIIILCSKIMDTLSIDEKILQKILKKGINHSTGTNGSSTLSIGASITA